METLAPAKALHPPANGIIRFWRSLADSDQPVTRYLGRALIADIPISLAVVALVGWLARTPMPTFEGYPLDRVIIVMCVVTPALETLLMAAVFWGLKLFIRSTHARAFASAVIWAFFHSLAKPVWGLQIFWTFYILSICYLAWQKRSAWHALGVTTLLHGLHNCVPALFLAITRASTDAP